MSDATVAAPVADAPAELQLQPAALRSLTSLVAQGRAHAFLLAGAPGNGPLAAADWVAAQLLTPEGADAATRIQIIQRVTRRSHPDLISVIPEGAELRRQEIGEAISQLVRKPFEAPAQVVVIHRSETANASAWNQLLKTLEEPPGRVVFILLASSAERVIDTIRSRAIEIRFPPLPDDAIATWLAERQLTGGLPHDIAGRLAAGHLDRGRELASGGPALDRRSLVVDLVARTARGDIPAGQAAEAIIERADAAEAAAREAAEAAFAAERELLPEKDAKRLARENNPDGHPRRAKRTGRLARTTELDACLTELAYCWRDIMALANGSPDSILGVDAREVLQQVAAGPGGPLAVHALDAIEATRTRLAVNTQPATTLAALCTELELIGRGRVTARRALGPGAGSPLA